jgi:hypothetical protein
MAKKIDSREQITNLEKQTEELKKHSEVMRSHNDYSKSYNQSLEKGRSILKDITGLQSDQAQISKSTQSIEKNINALFADRTKSEKLINSLKISQHSNSKKLTSEAKNFSGITDRFLKGEVELDELYRAREQFIGTDFYKTLEELIELMEKSPNLSDKLKVEADAQQKIDDFQKNIEETTALLSSPKAMGVAAIGLAAKLATDFANQALEVRQQLGTSAADSAILAGNMQVASLQAFVLGGSTQEAASAVTSLTREFGSLDAVTPRVAKQAASITAQFGIGGENLGRLTKQMSVLNGASLETNLNTLETVGNLARAERVAPADVLNDMAESTETFAKFSMDGGKNLAKAAIEARKLGLNLQAVDKISESILDIEGSIEKQMEASVLLGRQLNLDKARELALSGDLEGVLAEVKNQVGGAEALSRMNVVQRKALADAVGLEVSELSKLAAGQKDVNAAAAAQKATMVSTFATVVGIATVLGGIVGMLTGGAAVKAMAKGAIKGAGIGAGIGVLGGAAAAVGQQYLPKAQTGGVVRETGMAVVHKGETIAGTQFGGRESNKLLKQMIEQNATLMNRLTNKVGDLALSS